MEKELVFVEKLSKLRETAKDQGNTLSDDQIKEALEDFSLDEEQTAMVYDYFKKHNIGIGELVDFEDRLCEEEKSFLDMYLEELKEIPALSDGEKEALILSSMAGETESQDKLVTAMLPQVVDIAKLYIGQGVLMEDLIGEGNVSLAMSVKMLNSMETAAEAESLLIKMIMNAMEDYIEMNAADHKQDLKILEKVNKVLDAAKKLAEDYSRKVTPLELSEESKLSIKAIQDAINMSGGKIEYLENDK